MTKDRRLTLNRRAFSAVFAAAAATMMLSPSMADETSTEPVDNVVLVHGLYADGSSWSNVIALLQAEGLNVTAAQIPTTTFEDAVTEVEHILSRQDGPTVLVGHSFGGMVITEAGNHPNVSSLVYIAARGPDANEDFAALAATYPTPPASEGIVYEGDEGRLSEEAFLRDFVGDVPEDEARVLYAVQKPFQRPLLSGVVSEAAWRSKPSFYAVSTQDRTIDPDFQRFMADRMGATTIEIDASHVPMISQPEAVAELILDATGR
jgi:pimeloyl-ACP methyl ester carboxylesterase